MIDIALALGLFCINCIFHYTRAARSVYMLAYTARLVNIHHRGSAYNIESPIFYRKITQSL